MRHSQVSLGFWALTSKQSCWQRQVKFARIWGNLRGTLSCPLGLCYFYSLLRYLSVTRSGRTYVSLGLKKMICFLLSIYCRDSERLRRIYCTRIKACVSRSMICDRWFAINGCNQRRVILLYEEYLTINWWNYESERDLVILNEVYGKTGDLEGRSINKDHWVKPTGRTGSCDPERG